MRTSRTPLVVLGATLLLAGCGTGGGGAAGQSTEQLDRDAKVEGEITFWHAYSEGGPEVETLEKTVIPAFEKENPGATVKPVTVQYDQLHQKLVTAAAGEALPDVVRSDIIWVPELADLGVLVPLDQAMPDFDELAEQTYDGSLATNQWQDSYYGLPLTTNTKVMLYNEEALAAAEIEEPPATFDELRDAAPALAEKGKFVLAEGDAAGWQVLPYIWSNGGDVTDEEITTADGHLNGEKSVEAIELLVDLHEANGLPKLILGGGGGTNTFEGLAKGMYATIVDGPWAFPIIEGQFKDFEMKTAPMPHGDGESTSVVGGENLVMTQASENKELAAAFVRHMLSEESQLAMAEAGQISVLKDLADEMVEIEPSYEEYMTQLETARPRPPTPAWTKIDEIIRKQVQLAIRGDMSAQEAMDQAVEQIDPLLQRG
jgi:multiple sugar transport system substrate-binding protein